uniref:hypothetical protein n=1 Tax=Agathobacter sp. TaxID=2021311 RepID=UPI004057BF0B
MLYQSQRMKLECVRIVKKGTVNDIFICRDVNTAAGNLYTLLVIKEHRTVKTCLEIFQKADIAIEDACVDSFSDNGMFCMVFEYKQERPLMEFYRGDSYTLAQCEDVCIHVIMACMAAKLPYPFLYLILKQNQIHLAKDHSVYLSYQIDLSELETRRRERDCAVRCAAILQELLEPKASQKAFSYHLLERKIRRNSYERFSELHKDIRIAAAPKKEQGIFAKIKKWFALRQETWFRILLVICAVFMLVAIVSLVSQFLFGDIPWLRIFFNGFKRIGTEMLVQ